MKRRDPRVRHQPWGKNNLWHKVRKTMRPKRLPPGDKINLPVTTGKIHHHHHLPHGSRRNLHNHHVFCCSVPVEQRSDRLEIKQFICIHLRNQRNLKKKKKNWVSSTHNRTKDYAIKVTGPSEVSNDFFSPLFTVLLLLFFVLFLLLIIRTKQIWWKQK